ncbi:MAG: NAD-dependent epimerase/dehydratase family protein [Bacteroidota bacterium]
MMKKTAFVTGASGFLGINLIRQLLKDNWDVVAFHRPSSNIKYLESFDIKRVQGDLTDYASIHDNMPERVDAVFHTAAITRLGAKHHEKQYIVNVTGTKNMLHCAMEKKAGRFIYTSSISSYGVYDFDITEKTPANINEKSCNYYNYTKYLAEKEVKKAAENGLHAVILNPCRIIGPYDTRNWINLIKMVRDNYFLMVPRGVGMICHVDDIARAHLSAAEKGIPGENYLLGGERASFKDLINVTIKILNRKPLMYLVPAWLLNFVGYLSSACALVLDADPGLTIEKARLFNANVTCNYQKAIQQLDYQVSPVEKTIRDSCEWLMKEGTFK